MACIVKLIARKNHTENSTQNFIPAIIIFAKFGKILLRITWSKISSRVLDEIFGHVILSKIFPNLAKIIIAGMKFWVEFSVWFFLAINFTIQAIQLVHNLL